MGSRLGGGLAVLAVLCVVASGLTVAAGGYSLSSPDASPAPERTEEIQGTEFTVDSRVSADPGDSITVESTAPDEESYWLYLYNSDGETEIQQRVDGGDATVEFDLGDVEPGSYAVGTFSNADGEIMAVLPVLVRGYDVSASAPGQVASDESFEVTVDVTATAASGDPAEVTAIFADETGEHTVEASGSDGSYAATVDAADLGEGEYTVYGAVQGGDESIEGERELLGIDEAGTLTVQERTETETPTETETATETETETATETSGSDGSTGGSGGSGGGGDEAPAGEATPTESNGSTGTQTDVATATEGESPTETETATETDDGAITPSNGSTDGEETTGADGPGFGAVSVIAALIAVGILGTRRR